MPTLGSSKAYLGGVLAQINGQTSRGSAQRICRKTCVHYVEINAAHPFREGNGKIRPLCFAQLAEQAGYFIDFDLAAKDDVLKAMIADSRAMKRH